MRKGSINMLAGIVIVVLVVLIAIPVYLKFKDVGDTSEEASCATAVKAHSTAISLSKKTTEAANLPILCPTRYVTLQTNNQEEVKESIAKEMKTCWNVWGKGEYKLFQDDGIYCHVCGVVRTEGVEQISGFSEYLNTHKATGDITYTEYLTGHKAGTKFEDTAFPGMSTSTMPAKQVAVIFYHANGKSAIEKMFNSIAGNPALGASTGFLSGAVVGAAVCYGVGVVVTFGSGGFGFPVLVGCAAMGATAGAVAGGVSAYAARIESGYMSMVVVRPLTSADLTDLKCEYAPATNQ